MKMSRAFVEKQKINVTFTYWDDNENLELLQGIFITTEASKPTSTVWIYVYFAEVWTL